VNPLVAISPALQPSSALSAQAPLELPVGEQAGLSTRRRTKSASSSSLSPTQVSGISFHHHNYRSFSQQFPSPPLCCGPPIPPTLIPVGLQHLSKAVFVISYICLLSLPFTAFTKSHPLLPLMNFLPLLRKAQRMAVSSPPTTPEAAQARKPF